MNIQDLLKKQDHLINLKSQIERSLKEKTHSFRFGGEYFTYQTMVEEVLRPMMEQHLVNTQEELTKVNDLVKSINCLVAGTMPEKVKL